MSEKEEIERKTKLEMVTKAKGLARWFSVDVIIRIFGHVVWEYHFPPQNEDK